MIITDKKKKEAAAAQICGGRAARPSAGTASCNEIQKYRRAELRLADSKLETRPAHCPGGLPSAVSARESGLGYWAV